jgi:FkbM family methyltransferase
MELRTKTKTIEHDFDVKFRELNLTAQAGDITILPSLIDGSFEETEINIFQNFCKNISSLLVIDVGANIGIYSIIAGKSIRDDSKVIAFEPDPNNVRRFIKNVVKHELNNIEIVEAAVGDNIDVKLKTFSYGGVTRLATRHEQGEHLVPSYRLDEFLDSRAASFQNFILKVDIEGFEPTVIRHSWNFIQKKLPIIFLEISFEKDRTCLDEWGDDLKKLIKLYAFAYLVTNKKIRQITLDDLSWIYSSSKLHTLICTNLRLEIC